MLYFTRSHLFDEIVDLIQRAAMGNQVVQMDTAISEEAQVSGNINMGQALPSFGPGEDLAQVKGEGMDSDGPGMVHDP